ncbi:MAG: hypothetical protein [Caudoviricetes sp.]|nr:MAG: hypothetical protein [Caudoviricetes sp.]
MNIYEQLGIIKGTKDQATATITKYGIEWLVMEKDGKKYTWDHNGAMWCKTTIFDEFTATYKPKPKQKQHVKEIEYYTPNRRYVGD